MSGYIVERIGPDRPIEPRASLALRLARKALENAGRQCRYHGQDWDFLGREPWRETAGQAPRCDSCKQPWRVVAALSAIDRALGSGDAAS